MSYTPTPEQVAVVDAAKETSDNLLISALAGAAKTSTLILIAEALDTTKILCLAFNKKIADEMKDRLPRNCDAMTLNSLGHRVWGDAIGRRLMIEPSKTYDLLSAALEASDDKAFKKEVFDDFAEILRTIDFGKACGWIPNEFSHPAYKAKRLMDDDEFFAHIDQDYSAEIQSLIVHVTLKSLTLAFEGKCDYNDQILMPTVFHGAFPRYPLVLVDEAQDLSALNHAMIRKLVGVGDKARRLIAVGDQNQAIYGFRGAHQDSMELLRQEFSMRELRLTVSFRCPIKIVEHARWRAPDMKYPDWAKPGSVTYTSMWGADDLTDTCAVICRNNAPLFALAIKLLKNGRYAELLGNDIGKGLLKIMRKFGGHDLSQRELLDAIASWEEQKIAANKSRAAGGIRDRAECMRIFARQGEDLGEALAFANHVFSSRGPIKLMTGHKSKGLEFPDIFFLDESLIGDDGQEPNLRYVIQTRSKETLTYVELKDFVDT